MMNHSLETYQFFFGALANPNRLQIINVLRKGRKNVSEVCKATKFEQTMVSHNLKVLEHHGMVFKEKQGKYRYYTVNKKTIKPLLEFIDSHMEEYCCKILESEKSGNRKK
jgi:DNA-binding transcriptional ArsR family regulator